MNKFNVMNVLHWLSVASGVAVAGAGAVSGDPKLAGIATVVISVSQVVHKIVDALDTPAK